MQKQGKMKHWRKFGQVTVTSGKDVKVIRPEQWLRCDKNNQVVTDNDGELIIKSVDKIELSSNKALNRK